MLYPSIHRAFARDATVEIGAIRNCSCSKPTFARAGPAEREQAEHVQQTANVREPCNLTGETIKPILDFDTVVAIIGLCAAKLVALGQ